MQDETLLQVNMRALRRRYPEYADMLSVIPESSRYTFDEAGASISCKDSDGTWVHGPEDPWNAARQEVQNAVGGEPELYLVVRAGLGYHALALLEVLSRRSPGWVLVVVEERLELVKAALSRLDWSPMLLSASTVLLFGDVSTIVEEFLGRHPAISLLPISLFVPAEATLTPRLEPVFQRISSLASRTRTSFERQLSATNEQLSVRRERRLPLRVLLTVPELGYLSGPIADGFRACGAGVEVEQELGKAVAGVRAHDWLREISRFAPDIVLWMNRPALSRTASLALRDLGIANVHWSVDSPRRMRITQDELAMVDVHLLFDPSYLDQPRGGAAKASVQLSIAAGLEPVPGCGPDACWPERLGPRISFVGSFGYDRISELRELLSRTAPEQLRLLDELARAPGDPSGSFESITGRPYEGAPCLYIDEVRSTAQRVSVLSAMTSLGLSIYGGIDWYHAAASLSACYKGGVHYGSDLSGVYYHSEINLNVFHTQCVNSTNSRVYDVLAAGGFLLTEYRTVLAEEFEVGRHLITFATLDEAREKAEYYLSHPAEREAIAREGQRHVLTHHTFAKRCEKILRLALPYVGRSDRR